MLALYSALFRGHLALAGTVKNFDNADTCSEIRLDRGDGPFAKLPVYNQALRAARDPDMCYAITASLLIDANRVTKGQSLQQLTSPISIALNARRANSVAPESSRKVSYDDSDMLTYLVSGGSISDAIAANQSKSACDQRWLERHVTLFTDDRLAQSVDRFVLSLVERSSALAPNPALFTRAVENLERICAGNQIPINTVAFEELRPPGGDFIVEQQKLVQHLQSNSLSPVQRQQLVAEFKKRFDPIRKIQLFAEKIHEVLESSKSKGVGIGFLYRALGNTEHPNSVAGHAAVIVGRSFNPVTRRCELLVRDSYGAECQTSTGTNRYLLPCENGTISVEMNNLLKDAMKLVWIP